MDVEDNQANKRCCEELNEEKEQRPSAKSFENGALVLSGPITASGSTVPRLDLGGAGEDDTEAEQDVSEGGGMFEKNTEVGEEHQDSQQEDLKTKTEFSIYRVPEEVWELILNEVKDDEDKQNCCRASPYFDKILTKSKPVWKFKEVLEDVDEYLTEAERLACRLVCKQWKEDVDHLIQNEDYDPIEEYRNTFRTVAEIDHCLQTFNDHPDNPFIDRTVHFSALHLEREYAPKTREFIVKFGKHVWNLRMENMHLGPGPFYGHLRFMLNNTPNIRKLTVDGVMLNMNGVDDDYLQRLSNAIAAKPLPTLPDLETLWFRTAGVFDECPAILHNAVMAPYLGQLKSWAIYMNSWQDAYAEGLTKLEKTILGPISFNSELSKVLRLTAPIKSIKLIFAPTTKIELALIIKVLCQFPLEEVNMILHDDAEFVDPEGEGRHLIRDMKNEKVESFEIAHGPKFSYNFLKLFPSLENLRVGLGQPLEAYIEGGGWKESESDVQFYKMMEEGQMYKSNIWALFPELEEVEIYNRSSANNAVTTNFLYRGERDFYNCCQWLKDQGHEQADDVKLWDGKIM